MVHKSENERTLKIQSVNVANVSDISFLHDESPAIWLFILPFGRSLEDVNSFAKWYDIMREFSMKMNNDSVVCFLTSPPDAAVTVTNLQVLLKYQLWVSVKLSNPLTHDGELSTHHHELIIFSKYRRSLRHTKTRIAYTYCPYCEKTTKDYGGKKHLYDAYGTLMSDVWRDVSYVPDEYPVEIVNRLSDLFGLDPYRELKVIDLKDIVELKPFTNNYKIMNQISFMSKNQPLRSGLINRDCIEYLRKLPSDSVDYCFADPPYNINKKYDSCTDDLDIIHYFEWCDEWLYELYRILKPGHTCSILNIPLWSVRHFEYMKSIMRFQYWITWEGLSLPVRMIMPAHYAILCFSKSEPRPVPGFSRENHTYLENLSLTTQKEDYCLRASCLKIRRTKQIKDIMTVTDMWWDIHRLKHNSRRLDHPCQLPPVLMKRLIAMFTYENEMVLDPFNGIGTTTLSAQMLNRRYIGIELSENYHQVAMNRHNLLDVNIDPFQKNSETPKTKNSRVKRIKKQKYEVTKKILQLEIKDISIKIGRLPTRDDVANMSKYPMKYYDEYFISWGEVCAAARTTGMTDSKSDKVQPSSIIQQDLFDL